MSPNHIEKQVEQGSKFWHKHQTDLARTKKAWRGCKAYYLDIVNIRIERQIERKRRELIKWTGWDVVTNTFVPSEPREPFTLCQVDLLLNIERDALQTMSKRKSSR